MKTRFKYLIFIAVHVLIVFTVKAQNYSKYNLRFGVGGSMTKLEYLKSQPNERIITPNAGLTGGAFFGVGYELGKHFELQYEVGYAVLKGNGAIDSTMNVAYVDKEHFSNRIMNDKLALTFKNAYLAAILAYKTRVNDVIVKALVGVQMHVVLKGEQKMNEPEYEAVYSQLSGLSTLIGVAGIEAEYPFHDRFNILARFNAMIPFSNFTDGYDRIRPSGFSGQIGIVYKLFKNEN